MIFAWILLVVAPFVAPATPPSLVDGDQLKAISYQLLSIAATNRTEVLTLKNARLVQDNFDSLALRIDRLDLLLRVAARNFTTLLYPNRAPLSTRRPRTLPPPPIRNATLLGLSEAQYCTVATCDVKHGDADCVESGCPGYICDVSDFRTWEGNDWDSWSSKCIPQPPGYSDPAVIVTPKPYPYCLNDDCHPTEGNINCCSNTVCNQDAKSWGTDGVLYSSHCILASTALNQGPIQVKPAFPSQCGTDFVYCNEDNHQTCCDGYFCNYNYAPGKWDEGYCKAFTNDQKVVMTDIMKEAVKHAIKWAVGKVIGAEEEHLGYELEETFEESMEKSAVDISEDMLTDVAMDISGDAIADIVGEALADVGIDIVSTLLDVFFI